MKAMQVIIIRIIIGLAVVGGLAAGVGWWTKHGAAKQEETTVRVEPAGRGELIEIVSAPGRVKPKSKVSITSRVAARISDLPCPERTPVKKGDVLVRLDAKDLEAQLKGVQARFAAEESQLIVAQSRLKVQPWVIKAQEALMNDAKRQLERYKQLVKTQDMSEAQVQEQEAKVEQMNANIESAKLGLEADTRNLEVLRHTLEAAEAEIARVRDDLSYTVITAQIDGVVTKVNSEVGELVVPVTTSQAGMAIMEIADLSTMLVEARVDETSIARLEKGQKAVVRMNAYENEPFEGIVDTVALASTGDEGMGRGGGGGGGGSSMGEKYYETEVILKLNGKQIFSGLSADVDIQTKRHADVMKVPTQAVVGRSVDDLPPAIRSLPEVEKNKTITPVVYRYINGKAVATPVRIGPSDVTHTIVTAGLKEGEPVIIGPYKVLESLKHDQNVKDEKEKTPATQPAK
jgi:HlyD family secretion protein